MVGFTDRRIEKTFRKDEWANSVRDAREMKDKTGHASGNVAVTADFCKKSFSIVCNAGQLYIKIQPKDKYCSQRSIP